MKRKKLVMSIIIITAAAMLVTVMIKPGIPVLSHNSGHQLRAAKGEKVMYHCPMHPNYISDKPGTCPICGMNLVPVNSDRHAGAGATAEVMYYKDPDKPWITSDTPVKNAAGADFVPVYKGDTVETAIRIDPVTVQNMGVATATVNIMDLTREVKAGATVALNEKKLSIVSTQIGGWIDRLYVNCTGDKVRKGQRLFDLYSPELVSTQEEYLQALRYAGKLSNSPGSGGALELLQSSRRRLENWDIPESEIQALETRGTSKRDITFYAPSDGVVLEKNALQGQNIMPGMVIYKIADLSNVWVMANIYQADVPFVKTGMKADVELQARPGTVYTGIIQYISPVLDPGSKTAQVRVEVPNTADHALKPEMFADVTIHSTAAERAVAVPEQAVIKTGARNIMIIALGNGYFRPQEVRLGVTANGYVQVLEGLNEGQTIVTSSQFLIDSESNLKTAIGLMNSHGAMPMGEMAKEEQPEINKQHPANDKQVNNQMPNTGSMPAMDMKAQSTENNMKMQSAPTGSINEKAALKSKSATTLYTCPMDPDVISEDPNAKCPKCGMALVKK